MRLLPPRRYAVVNIVGPDGVGKTTLTESLVRRAGGRRHVLVVANREGGRPPTLLLHRRPGNVTRGHAQLLPPYNRALAVLKVLYLYADFLAAWIVRLLPHARHQGMVIVERGWWDIAVDAPRYRIPSAVGLVELLGRLLPRPDVLLVLDAPADVVTARKDQLPPDTVEQHRHTWRRLHTAAPTVFLDASAPAEEVLRQASAAIALAARAHGRLAPLQPADPAPLRDRSELLVPLLQDLSAAAPSLVVWKNADRALHGDGDLDLLCSPEDAAAVERVFRQWSEEHGHGPVVTCEHGGNGRYLLARANDGSFAELDLKWRLTSRGAQLFRIEQVPELVDADERGFRRLRPGAEGLLKLTVNGVRRTGAPRPHRIDAENVVELLRSDVAGAEAAARVFGLAEGQVNRATSALLQGRWDRPAWLRVQLLLAGRSLREPRALAARLAPRSGDSCHGLKPLVTRGVVHASDAAWTQHLPPPHSEQYAAAAPGTTERGR